MQPTIALLLAAAGLAASDLGQASQLLGDLYDEAPMVLIGKTESVINSSWLRSHSLDPAGHVPMQAVHVLRYFKGQGPKDVFIERPMSRLERGNRALDPNQGGSGFSGPDLTTGRIFLFFLEPSSSPTRRPMREDFGASSEFRIAPGFSEYRQFALGHLSFDHRLPTRLQIAELVAANLGETNDLGILSLMTGLGASEYKTKMGWDYDGLLQALRWIDRSLPRRYRATTDSGRLQLLGFQIACGLVKYSGDYAETLLRLGAFPSHGAHLPSGLDAKALSRLVKARNKEVAAEATKALSEAGDIGPALLEARMANAKRAVPAFLSLRFARPYAAEIAKVALARIGQDRYLDAQISVCLQRVLDLVPGTALAAEERPGLGLNDQLKHLREVARIECGI